MFKKSSPNFEVLTPTKIRGGLGEILAVRYRVLPRRNMWYNFYDAIFGRLGSRCKVEVLGDRPTDDATQSENNRRHPRT